MFKTQTPHLQLSPSVFNCPCLVLSPIKYHFPTYPFWSLLMTLAFWKTSFILGPCSFYMALKCFHGTMYTKRSHSLTIFTATHFVCVFLNIWRRFCDRIMQLKVNNILNCAHLNNAMVDWSTFLICKNLSQRL